MLIEGEPMQKTKLLLFITCCCLWQLSAQENELKTLSDNFLSMATDARAAGLGDIGVATSPDVFSQLWNPAKYMFSDEAVEFGMTHILGGNSYDGKLAQLNLSFYKQIKTGRSAYSLGVRAFANSYDPYDNYVQYAQNDFEIAIDGAYILKLSDQMAMSVGGRFITLSNKVTSSFDDPLNILYGVDVSAYYYGDEIGFNKFNGRWRAGVNLTNLRGKSKQDLKHVAVYVPTMLRVGVGFDFGLGLDNLIAVTTEYKSLLEDYTVNDLGVPLDYGVEGSVAGLGVEYVFKEKFFVRGGYSYGINREMDTFGSVGVGFHSRAVDVDTAVLLGLDPYQNPLRSKIRVSLIFNIAEILSSDG